MRKLGLILAAVILVLVATSALQAGVLSEDITYWFKTANGSGSMRNPNSDWLKANTENLLVKIQQTVYDKTSTLAMLNRNNPNEGTSHPGFLYAYSVTNLGVGDINDLTDMGLTEFHVDWRTPYYGTVSKQTPTGWSADNTVTSGPTWKWTPADPGILPGDTVGGFWAVSNIGVDGDVQAGVIHIGAYGERNPWTGTTTGPCPEPGAFVTLFAGFAGLGLSLKLRRKK